MDGCGVRQLTPAQQAAVLEARPMIDALERKLTRMFRQVPREDLAQILWTSVSEMAPDHDPARGTFEAFAYKRALGKAIDAAMREARQTPLYLARRAFGSVAEIHDAGDPFRDDGETLDELKRACHEGAFHLFFGATFEAWRMQGEQGLVDQMTRLEALRALSSAFTTLGPDEWKILEMYYVDCASWAEVGAALGISERHAKRRAEQTRERLRRELRARGVKGTPPPEA